MNKTFTFSRLCLTLVLALGAVVNLNAQQVLSFVYSKVGSEDPSTNICSYYDKDKIILDSDFGYSKGKDDVCNRNNGGEIDGYIMCKNAANACSRQSYTLPASLTLKLATQCKDRGTYTAPTVTIDGQTANFGSVTFDSDFDKKELTATLSITAGTHDISVSFAGSDKFYVSTLTLSSDTTTPGPGPGPGPGPTPTGDCPDGTALVLSSSVMSDWGGSFDPATSTMSFSRAWGGCGWNGMSADWTDYNNLYLKFSAALTGDFVMYINGTEDESEVGKALAGADSLVVDLSGVTTVSSIMFKYSVAGDVVLPCMVLREAGPATGLKAPINDIRLVEVYTLTGTRVARAASVDALPALERGAYVIRYNGAQCDKLVIK